MPKSIFFPGRGGDSNLKMSQTQGRRRTKMTHFGIWGSNTGKSVWTNMVFGRKTKNTPTGIPPSDSSASVLSSSR